MVSMLPRPSIIKRVRLSHASVQLQKRADEHILQQLFWECTLCCNLNCQHCGSDCRISSDMQDMPLEDFLSVLDDVRAVMDARKILVVTTGGEPLVRKDICECGKAIRERGFHWGLVSNGMLLDEQMCNRLLNAGLETRNGDSHRIGTMSGCIQTYAQTARCGITASAMGCI